MKYNLSQLSKPQADLDRTILENHSISDVSLTTNKRILAFLVELGELANETRCFKYWSIKQASETNVILEEYVDGIHFLTSLANQLELTLEFEVEENASDLTEIFIDVFSCAGRLKESFDQANLIELYKLYLQLGNKLGFDNNCIIEAYFKKNEINYQRQENGY